MMGIVSHTHTGFAATTSFVLILAIAPQGTTHDERSAQVLRRGILMGLDPGISQRLDETGMPLYARLDLRVGGCITPRLQLGMDWRMDLLLGGGDNPIERRHQIGPVLTFFIYRGWFTRAFGHLGGYNPWFATAGAQTGYEFPTGRFTAIGFALGADADIPLDGNVPTGYAFSALLYLTAYELGTRRDVER
jgi:hypothetical protein